MLVIGRIPGQSVYIYHNGERIRISFERDRDHRNGIRIGFDGPKSFRVIRDDAVEQEQKEQGNG